MSREAVSLRSTAFMTENSSDWRDQPTMIAIRDRSSDEWEYQTFPNWYEAREAINEARRAGKIALTYEGGSPDVPELIYPELETTQEQE